MFDAFAFRAAILGSAFACTVAGCAPKSPGRAAVGFPSAESSLGLNLLDSDSARETFFGDVMVMALPLHGVAVLLDGGPTPGMQDGFVDQAFVLQQEAPADFRARTIAGAELHYAGRALFVRDPGGASLLLAMEGSEINSVPASALAGAVRYEGFGLARRTGAWTVPLARAADSLGELLPIALR